MTPEQLAIAALFSALQGGWFAIVRHLLKENEKLEERLDKSNQASADLIAVQAALLRKAGVAPPEGGP